MLTDYGYIGLYLIAAVAFTLLLVIIPQILRLLKVVPHNPNKVKNATFECGMETIGKTWVQFNFRYYFYALVFLTVDVLVVFLFPWAVQLRALGYPAFFVVMILLAITLVGYVYAWRKGALEWK